MTRYLIAGVAILVLTSGCVGGLVQSPTPTEPTGGVHGSAKEWGLSIGVPDFESKKDGTVHCTIGVSGLFEGEIYGVRLQFLNEDKEVVKEVPVGNITDWSRHSVNTTLPTIPVYVTADVEGWNTPGLRPGEVSGTKITTDGDLKLYEKQLLSNETVAP